MMKSTCYLHNGIGEDWDLFFVQKTIDYCNNKYWGRIGDGEEGQGTGGTGDGY
jgi:hypothetical protein